MSKTYSETVKSLTYHAEDRVEILRSLSIPERSAAFAKLSPYVQQLILKELKINEIVDMFDHYDLQHVQRALTLVKNPRQREEIIRRLKGEVREKIDFFLRFHPKASLALINFNYLFLEASCTVGEAAGFIEEHYQDTGRYPELLVHENGTLIGEVPFASMVKERNTNTLKRFVNSIPTITYQAEVSEIVGLLTSTRSKKAVVLDHDMSVLGIIYADAARALFGDLPAESLYEFAGVDNSERPFDSVKRKVTNRYRWLVLNLATSFLAGSVVLSFQSTLDTITVLSAYIPIVAGMGGNAATQSLAIMVRGLTLGTISLKNAGPAILNEALAGIVNGAIIGTIVALISFFWGGGIILGMVVGLALIGAHLVAGVAGSFIPLLMKHLGKDPAATSTIFITTATDVLGLLFLLGLSTLILL